MSATTATVETLTAEVRVLMVGNRQVTLSVAKQLDRVPPSQVEAFGRIRLGSDDDRLLIGRDRGSGALVVAKVPYPESYFIFREDLDAPLTVCRMTQFPCRLKFVLDDESTTFSTERRAVKLCGRDHFDGTDPPCEGWLPNGQEGAILAALRSTDRFNDSTQAAMSLPLIVLAGLR